MKYFKHASTAALIFLVVIMLTGMGKSMKYQELLPGQLLPIVEVPGKIVFQSNRNGNFTEIWVIENKKLKLLAKGQNQNLNVPQNIANIIQGALSSLQEPSFSPSGSEVLCSGNGDLSILNEQGEIIKSFRPGKGAVTALWSPNKDQIYYTAVDELPSGGGSQNIYRYDLKDESIKKISNLEPFVGIRPILNFAVAPNNEYIALTTMDKDSDGISIWKIQIDTQEMELLVRYATDPAFSPDGKKIAYASSALPTGEEISDHEEIFILDLETGERTRLTDNMWRDRNPVFSPDGSKIAFVSYRHRIITHGSEIFVINTDGTGEARITPPAPNPDYPNDPYRGWATDEHPDWTA